MSIEELLGKTLISVVRSGDDEQIEFITSDGERFLQYHAQDCCEHVRVEEIVGDLADLVGSPILEAEEVSYDNEVPPDAYAGGESFTWTFYKLRTIKGGVTIRWLGESNGYYSEAVDFQRA